MFFHKKYKNVIKKYFKINNKNNYKYNKIIKNN